MRLTHQQLLQAAERDELGRVREHFQACDGFEAAQDMARLVDALANGNAIVLWNMLRQIHKWQR